jgi:biotin-(acetyl-CoA carboxylase) ligase
MIYLLENAAGSEFGDENAAFVATSALPEADQFLWRRFSEAEELVRLETDSDGFWKRAVVVNESKESQFDTVVELARSESPPAEAFACIALAGSGFHGNRGRAWEALRGNLHFSSFCPLDLDAATYGPALSMLPTLAVLDLIEALPGAGAVDPPWIKWVNDVYLGDGKVSGSLVSTQLDGGRIISCELGIGINLESAPELGLERYFGAATSLRDHGIVAAIPDVFPRLLDLIQARLTQLSSPEGASALARNYRDRVGGVGRLVEILQEQQEEIIAKGRLLDVHADLSLEVEGFGRVEKGRLRFADAG